MQNALVLLRIVEFDGFWVLVKEVNYLDTVVDRGVFQAKVDHLPCESLAKSVCEN